MPKKLAKNFYQLDQMAIGEAAEGPILIDAAERDAYLSELADIDLPPVEKVLSTAGSSWVSTSFLSGHLMGYVSLIVVAASVLAYSLGSQKPGTPRNFQESPVEFQVSLHKVAESKKGQPQFLSVNVKAPRIGSFYAVVMEFQAGEAQLIYPDSLQAVEKSAFLPNWTLPAMIFSKDSKVKALVVLISDQPISQEDLEFAKQRRLSQRYGFEEKWLEIHKLGH